MPVRSKKQAKRDDHNSDDAGADSIADVTQLEAGPTGMSGLGSPSRPKNTVLGLSAVRRTNDMGRAEPEEGTISTSVIKSSGSDVESQLLAGGSLAEKVKLRPFV